MTKTRKEHDTFGAIEAKGEHGLIVPTHIS